MENFSIVQKQHRYRQRLIPIKNLSIQENGQNFSFADWKPTLIKRSPTSISLSKRPLITEFYKQEQKKMIKIHRSFDHSNQKSLAEVHRMNKYIGKILNQHSENKKNFCLIKKSLNDLQFSTKDNIVEYKKTPHFIEPKNNSKFPREVFSSLSKRTRAYSKL